MTPWLKRRDRSALVVKLPPMPTNGAVHVQHSRPRHPQRGDIWIYPPSQARVYDGDGRWIPLNIDPQRKDY